MNVMDEEGNGVWEEISDMTNHCPKYSCDELEFIDIPIDVQKRKIIEPDYWDKLHHQAAIMAMQGLVSNPNIREDICITDTAIILATELVEKLKNEN